MKVNPFRNAQFALSAPELRQLPRDAAPRSRSPDGPTPASRAR
jgi:hypothetical protein